VKAANAEIAARKFILVPVEVEAMNMTPAIRRHEMLTTVLPARIAFVTAVGCLGLKVVSYSAA